MVSEITSLFPHCDEKSVSSKLRSRGILVKRDRVQDSLRRVNPSGVILRSRAVLHRRSYQVSSPNALWHLDGYHKLIRWRFVIHGAVDGFSRLITFLKVADNNRAKTVLNAYLQAVDEFGLPSRVRMDKGGENVAEITSLFPHCDEKSVSSKLRSRGILVKRDRVQDSLRRVNPSGVILRSRAVLHRRSYQVSSPTGRGSAITGRSIHNQRIERLWRDLFSGCISFFYSMFYTLEDNGLLNINCALDLYALHFVFIPILQEHLDLFRHGWAHHHMRTEHNRSPQQLWILGLQSIPYDDRTISGLNVWNNFTYKCMYIRCLYMWSFR